MIICNFVWQCQDNDVSLQQKLKTMEEKWKYNCKVDLRDNGKPESKLITVADGRMVIKLSFCDGKKPTMNVWALENDRGEDIRCQIELDESYTVEVKQLSTESNIKEECYEKSDTGIKIIIPREGTKVKHSVAVIS